MGISVYVRRESGEQVEGAVNQPLYTPLLHREDSPQEFPMLWHIDPYGTTVLNGRQTQSLLNELDAVHAREPSEDSRRAMDDLTYLCHLAIGMPHRFLWFVGD